MTGDRGRHHGLGRADGDWRAGAWAGAILSPPPRRRQVPDGRRKSSADVQLWPRSRRRATRPRSAQTVGPSSLVRQAHHVRARRVYFLPWTEDAAEEWPEAAPSGADGLDETNHLGIAPKSVSHLPGTDESSFLPSDPRLAASYAVRHCISNTPRLALVSDVGHEASKQTPKQANLSGPLRFESPVFTMARTPNLSSAPGPRTRILILSHCRARPLIPVFRLLLCRLRISVSQATATSARWGSRLHRPSCRRSLAPLDFMAILPNSCLSFLHRPHF